MSCSYDTHRFQTRVATYAKALNALSSRSIACDGLGRTLPAAPHRSHGGGAVVMI